MIDDWWLIDWLILIIEYTIEAYRLFRFSSPTHAAVVLGTYCCKFVRALKLSFCWLHEVCYIGIISWNYMFFFFLFFFKQNFIVPHSYILPGSGNYMFINVIFVHFSLQISLTVGYSFVKN